MFTIKDFIRHISPKTLQQYCNKHKLSINLKIANAPEKIIENFLEQFETLEQKIQNQIEYDFQEVFQLVGHKGTRMLIDEANSVSYKLPDYLEDMARYDKAMWFYLNNNQLFNETLVKFEIENSLGWRPFFATAVDIDAITQEQLSQLEKELEAFYYRQQLMGKNCFAEQVKKDDLTCFVIYVEDQLERYLEFDDKKQLNKKTSLRPIFKVYFLYNPKEARIYLKTKGSMKVRTHLINIFGNIILKQADLQQNHIYYDLSPLLSPSFEFVTPPHDNVEQIKIKSIQLNYPKAYNKHINLTMSKDGFSLETLHQWIQELNLPTNINVGRLKLWVKFKKTSSLKGYTGSVTFDLTPKTCNLGVNNLHLKVKQYLRDWNIDTHGI